MRMSAGLRDRLQDRLREATAAGESCAAGTLRLILTAVRDRDRASDLQGDAPLSDAELEALLVEMVAQRRAEIGRCERCAQIEFAEREAREIAVIESLLPRKMCESDIAKAVEAAIAQVAAVELRDAGRVMAALKQRYDGALDLQAAKRMISERLH
jgi:uncharacterized protein YqeY